MSVLGLVGLGPFAFEPSPFVLVGTVLFNRVLRMIMILTNRTNMTFLVKDPKKRATLTDGRRKNAAEVLKSRRVFEYESPNLRLDKRKKKV